MSPHEERKFHSFGDVRIVVRIRRFVRLLPSGKYARPLNRLSEVYTNSIITQLFNRIEVDK